MKKRAWWLTIALVSITVAAPLMLWMMGCSDSTSPEENGDTTDTAPPTLSSIDVVNGVEIRIAFDEQVDRASAEHEDNYGIYRYDGGALRSSETPLNPHAEGDTLQVLSAALLDDEKTVQVSILIMNNGDSYYFVANDIKDMHGNTMSEPDTLTFIGVDTPDTTPPEILHVSPAAGATGVGIGSSVEVTFSEPMQYSSVMAAFEWTGGGGSVSYEMHTSATDRIYLIVPTATLENSTVYTARFKPGTAMDFSSNYLSEYSWTFTTTGVTDNTPPTITSTTPIDGATNVSVDVILQIRFSEPMDPNYQSEGGVVMTPSPGDGIVTWTDGNRTLNFDPDNPLHVDTAYNLIITEGAWRDPAGNPLAGLYSLVFSTGGTLPTGGFSGTVTGDPTSEAATDPEGTVVVAFMVNMATWGGDDEPPVGGFAIADQNGDYEVTHLVDDVYYPIAWLDTDGDGDLNFDFGDAFGLYGIDFTAFDPNDIDSVVISGGNFVEDVDIALFDQSAIHGHIAYDGALYQSEPQIYDCYVALFDTTDFDPATSTPVLASEAKNVVHDNEFWFNELDGLVEGTYYLGAFMDIDPHDGMGYNPILDPAGLYGIGENPTPITVTLGRDFGGIRIGMQDPTTR